MFFDTSSFFSGDEQEVRDFISSGTYFFYFVGTSIRSHKVKSGLEMSSELSDKGSTFGTRKMENLARVFYEPDLSIFSFFHFSCFHKKIPRQPGGPNSRRLSRGSNPCRSI